MKIGFGSVAALLVMMSFGPSLTKLWIGSIDKQALKVRAQYNPKELQIDKQIPWQDHQTRDNQPGSEGAEESQQSDLEFNGAPTRSMTIELLFDCYERQNQPNASIEAEVQVLEELSSVQEPDPSRPDLRRPHHCIVAWGANGVGMRPFLCVIESLITKYTMWNGAGMPVRATCTVKLKEARRMDARARTR